MKTIIRIMSLVLSLLTVLLLVPSFATAEETGTRLYAQNVSGVKGDVVYVKVRIAGNPGINGFQFRLAYDSDKLAYLSDESAVNRAGSNSLINDLDGFVEVMWTNLATYSSDLTLVTIGFELLEVGETSVDIVMDSAKGDCLFYIDGTDMIDIACTTEPCTVSCLPDKEYDFMFVADACETPVSGKAQVDLSMVNADNVFGYSVEVDFDPEKLSFDSVTFSEAFPYHGYVIKTVAEGKLQLFACTEIDAPVTGESPMASVFFNVIDPDKAVGSSYDVTLGFYNGQPAYTYANKHSTVLTPFTEGTTVTLIEDPFDPYDLNGDSLHTIADVTILLDFLAGKASLATGVSGDLTGDASVNISDVTALLDFLAAAV